MSLEFPLPDLLEYYASDPTLYVAHLIGHEGPGSLLSYLKSKGWCNTLSAGPSAGAKGYMFFSVAMDLTEEGEDQVEDIVTAAFQYLAMVRREGPQEWIFKECGDLSAMDFRFKDKQKPRPYVQALSRSLHDFPPHEVLSAHHLLTLFRPDLIEMVLDQLQPKYLRFGQDITSLSCIFFGFVASVLEVDILFIRQVYNILCMKLLLPCTQAFQP